MNSKIECEIQEAIKTEVDRALVAIKYNLRSVFAGLLWTIVLELEKEGGVGDIENLIRLVINSSKYAGPRDEEYPVWDEKSTEVIVNRMTKVLQKHGIEQSWNIGRGSKCKKWKRITI